MTKTQARVLLPNRGQMALRASDLESLLPEGQRARLVWASVERHDLPRVYAGIRAVEGRVGRSAMAPERLLARWLYATLDGVGRAREIVRLTDAHDAYRWVCGGVQVHHHTVSDFRTEHGEALDELLRVSIASLMAAGVVTLTPVAQDGIRVRASAGAGSFRRKENLEGYLETARAEVARLKAEVDADPAAAERARDAARRRAAHEREARLEKALARLPALEAIKHRQGKKPEQARGSMTEAEATVMTRGDGGVRPAYNPQLASDADSLVIVGVEVVTVGSDQGQRVPMVEQVSERGGRAPAAWLVDGGDVGHDQIDRASMSTVV